jgi:hypothetical protein
VGISDDLDRLSALEEWMRQRGVRTLRVGDVQIVLGPRPSAMERLAHKAEHAADDGERAAAKQTMQALEKRIKADQEEQEIRDMVAATCPDAPQDLVDALLGKPRNGAG